MLRAAPLLFLAAVPVRAAPPPDLPPGWRVVAVHTVPAARLPDFARRLGGAIAALENFELDVNGFPARLNRVRAADAAAAGAIEARLRAMRGADFVRRRGLDVFEVAGDQVLVARRVFAAVGFDRDAVRRVRGKFRLALVAEVDQASANRVLNAMMRAGAGVREEAARWRFGTALRLRTGGPGLEVAYAFAPAPAETEDLGDGTTLFRFAGAPRVHGIPYVDVTATWTVRARWTPGGAVADAAASTAPRPPYWPRDADGIAALTDGLDGDAEARGRALLRRIAARVRPGRELGTRKGVAATLRSGTGQCWDRSDVLVAACRAAGVPARQVAGWVPALDAGHVWTEVGVGGKWLPVDATTTWLGTSADYLPLFLTDDGPMPLAHLRWPSFEPLMAAPGEK